jgi:hypothetical protein
MDGVKHGWARGGPSPRPSVIGLVTSFPATTLRGMRCFGMWRYYLVCMVPILYLHYSTVARLRSRLAYNFVHAA